MAYTVKTEGMDDLIRTIGKLGDAAQGVAAAGLYEGAGVMADAVSKAVHGIATEPFKYATGGQKRKPSQEEKAILIAARRGVAKFRKNGLSVGTSVGIGTGYGKITWGHARSGTRTKYKVGYGGRARSSQVQEGKSSGISTKPVEVIANAIESGTSFMERQPFFRKASKQNEGKAVKAMDAEIQKRIDQITKNGGM